MHANICAPDNHYSLSSVVYISFQGWKKYKSDPSGLMRKEEISF
jgi:hypothetical protein